MKISRKEVEHVALLARLKLSEEEINLYTEQLNSILEYAAKIQEIDTENVAPTAHAAQLFNVFREDEVKPSLAQEKVLENAPEAENGFFRVPRIV
ncbi:MAG TPA: Asp-tRNA(Asn)/Glu-tRNA(Gln) amidotransferase subunit GatC [Peptococcaceae bacterium]|nr:Asp-tRNA(Asn)/Glu-tRNA(Gln) amidotransferase subunit GatC [Peptococcaceae bacterium]